MINESGIAVKVINAVRMLKRKIARMTTTRIAPSRRASLTVSTARRIRSACAYSTLIFTPSGIDCSSDFNTEVTLSLRSIVLMPGCLTTLAKTVSLPLWLPAPRLISGSDPIFTVATSLTKIGVPSSRTSITTFSMSDMLEIRPNPRIINSRASLIRKPPAEFSFPFVRASATSSSERL